MTTAVVRRTRSGVTPLLVAQAATQLSMGMTFLVLPLLALQLTGSPVWVAVVSAAFAAPALVLAPIGGALADTVVDRRTLLVLVTAVRGCITATIPVAVLLQNQSLAVSLVLTMSCILGASSSLFQSAFHTVVPKLVSTDAYASTNATIFATINLAQLLGPGIGGILISSVGMTGTSEIAACANLPCMLGFLVIRAPLAAGRPPPGQISIWRRTIEGVLFVGRHRQLRSLMGLWFFVFVGTGSFLELSVVHLAGELHSSARTIGFVAAVVAAGGVVGPLLLRVVDRNRGAGSSPRWTDGQFMVSSAGIAGILVIVLSALGTPASIAVLGGGMQALLSINVVKSISVGQRLTPEFLLGRVMAIAQLVEQTAITVSLILMGWLTAARGALSTFAILGGVIVVGSALAMWGPLARRATAPPQQHSANAAATGQGVAPSAAGAAAQVVEGAELSVRARCHPEAPACR